MRLRSVGLLSLVCALALAALSACGSAGLGDPLSGTSWQLAAADGAAAMPDVKVTATFKDGQVSGSGGCNSYGGKYKVSGDKLQIEDLVSTLMACEDTAVMDQEATFLGNLGKAESFEVSEGKLEILTSDGKIVSLTRAE